MPATYTYRDPTAAEGEPEIIRVPGEGKAARNSARQPLQDYAIFYGDDSNVLFEADGTRIPGREMDKHWPENAKPSSTAVRNGLPPQKGAHLYDCAGVSCDGIGRNRFGKLEGPRLRQYWQNYRDANPNAPATPRLMMCDV